MKLRVEIQKCGILQETGTKLEVGYDMVKRLEDLPDFPIASFSRHESKDNV